MKNWRRLTFLILKYVGISLAIGGFLLFGFAPNDYYENIYLILIIIGLFIFLCHFLFKPKSKEKRKKSAKEIILLIFCCLGVVITSLGLILTYKSFSSNPLYAKTGKCLIPIGLFFLFCDFLFGWERKKKQKKSGKKLVLQVIKYVSMAIMCVGMGFFLANIYVPNPLYADLGWRITMLGTLIYLVVCSIEREKNDKNDKNNTNDTKNTSDEHSETNNMQ